jgi:pimeloyl-ACP methyl ester carboxylesterase/class 3 adenylate cyclase
LSGDVSVAYAVVGDGPFDVVFVSGWIVSNFGVAWEGSPADFYRGLSGTARLILLDKRGTGMSDRSTGIADLQTRMDDIRAVMDAVGSSRAAIVGVSEGGPMSMLFAATYPERAAALVLYGASPTWTGDAEYPWAPSPDEFLKELEESRGRRMAEAWYDEMLQGFAPSVADDEGARRWWRRWLQSSGSPGTVHDLRMMNKDIDVRHVLPAIRVPTLVLHREDDDGPVLAEAQYLADRIPGAEFVVLPGADHGWWVNPEQITSEIERFLTKLWEDGDWDIYEPERILATVMFTDIVDSTMKLAELGDRGWRELLARHHALVRRQLVRFSGREVDTTGDGFFATFDGPARAIRCGEAITHSVRSLGIEVRVGLHTGECEVVDGKVGGIAVHIGARVAAKAGPGEVLVSSTVRDLVAGSGIDFDDRGITELKGVPGEWRLYQVLSDPSN